MKDVDDFLAHYGVRGMKWGIRKSAYASNSNPRERKPLTRSQKIAAAGVVGAVVLGGIATAVILKNRGSVPTGNLGEAQKAKDFVAKKFEEPIRPIFVSKTTVGGYRYMGRGGLKDASAEVFRSPIAEFEKNGQREGFKRYGDNLEKIAVRFKDPNGRLDQATRPIHHDLIIPKDMASDIKNIDDVMTKVWPKISAAYDRLVQFDENTKN